MENCPNCGFDLSDADSGPESEQCLHCGHVGLVVDFINDGECPACGAPLDDEHFVAVD